MKMRNLKNLNEVFGLAKIQEEYLNSNRKSQRSSILNAKPSILGLKPELKLESRFRLPLQRLSPAQMEERRRKGLCFNCDEKFQPGHQCKSAKLFLLESLYPFQESSSNVLLVELDDFEATLLQLDVDKSDESRSEPKMVDAEITRYALLCSPSPGTMRIKRKINRHWLIILIDTGSTHNFIDATIVSILQLPLDYSATFEVKVANGASIRTQGVFSNFKVIMQGQVSAVNLNGLALGDCELVLGTQWLRTLGLIQWDFLEMFMVFHHLNSTMKIVRLQPTGLTIQKGTKFFRPPVKKGLMLQIVPLAATSSSSSQCALEIEELLTKFVVVFEIPTGLPPYRGHEHQILLKGELHFLDLHLQNLRVALNLLLQHQLYSKRNKHVFGISEVEYPGHIISGQGVKESFRKLKAVVCQPHVLALLDFSKPFTIECDASGVGLGAILMQEQRPISFHNQLLKGKALHLSTYEKELLALVTIVHKRRPYLLGGPFVIKIDQQSLKYILEQWIATPAQQKWLAKLLDYLFVVEYKKGYENKVVDALSKRVDDDLMEV
ncbi:uncharacterized protein LOC142624966 [Castanea sativa]|uniref:uncharacterized protein LOC142624966 n=1 Tax=Castanea sativa TaxID=21020 RepID=UPI003F64E1F2